VEYYELELESTNQQDFHILVHCDILGWKKRKITKWTRENRSLTLV